MSTIMNAVLPMRMAIDAIADLLNISTNTVKTHLRSVYRKLGVEDRDAAVERAGQLGPRGGESGRRHPRE